MRVAQRSEKAPLEVAGYSVSRWTAAVGIGRATYYTMSPEHRPQSVKIGVRHIIIETPGDWLARMARHGGVPIPQRKPA